MRTFAKVALVIALANLCLTSTTYAATRPTPQQAAQAYVASQLKALDRTIRNYAVASVTQKCQRVVSVMCDDLYQLCSTISSITGNANDNITGRILTPTTPITCQSASSYCELSMLLLTQEAKILNTYTINLPKKLKGILSKITGQNNLLAGMARKIAGLVANQQRKQPLCDAGDARACRYIANWQAQIDKLNNVINPPKIALAQELIAIYAAGYTQGSAKIDAIISPDISPISLATKVRNVFTAEKDMLCARADQACSGSNTPTPTPTATPIPTPTPPCIAGAPFVDIQEELGAVNSFVLKIINVAPYCTDGATTFTVKVNSYSTNYVISLSGALLPPGGTTVTLYPGQLAELPLTIAVTPGAPGDLQMFTVTVSDLDGQAPTHETVMKDVRLNLYSPPTPTPTPTPTPPTPTPTPVVTPSPTPTPFFCDRVPNPAGPVVRNIVAKIDPSNANKILVTWTTDVNADGIVNYGTTTNYGQYVNDFSWIVGHSLSFPLTPGVTNYWMLRTCKQTVDPNTGKHECTSICDQAFDPATGPILPPLL